MPTAPHGKEEWIQGLLAQLKREQPPELSLESVLSLKRRRATQRVFALAGIVASAAILLAIALGGSDAPPVHLDVKVVDVPDSPDDDGAVAAWFTVPEKARKP